MYADQGVAVAAAVGDDHNLQLVGQAVHLAFGGCLQRGLDGGSTRTLTASDLPAAMRPLL